MNRTGLAIALLVAAVVGVLFAVYPRLDIEISAIFYHRHGGFVASAKPWNTAARTAARWLITLILAPALLAIFGKLVLPHRRMRIGSRAAVFLVLTMALGPGVLANLILKDHWGRARPLDITEFGGTHRFTAWWDPRGDCPTNCSFIAGEPSGAFWTLAPAALAPPQWRLLAYGGALAFGVALGFVRIAAGGHFFSDVAFAGIFIFLLTLGLHWLIFRCAATRSDDETVERRLGSVGEAFHRSLAALLRVFARRSGKIS